MSNKKTPEKIEIIRHSTSHILAAAVLEMFPEAKFAIGPAIEDGFYYDFELPRTLIPEDLPLLEEKMKKIIADNHPFEKKMMQADEAIELFKKASQSYKVELIEDLVKEGEKEIMVYKSGSFVDLCSGPHLESTGEIDATAFKLTKISGAYWRGDENRQQLQRIYGVAFENKKKLKTHLQMMEEAEKRDHRKLGKELDLFSTSEKVGPGLILWHPKMSKVREILETWWREIHRKRGYDYIYTPHIGKAGLWKTSGHLDFFRESMYPPLKDQESGEEYFVKPMSCPFHVEIYKTKKRSYRDLPLRWNELGTCYRYEQTGEIHGMARPRGFTQDDAHVICTKEQFKKEYRSVVEFTLEVYQNFGFEKFKYYLAIRDPENLKEYAGDSEVWDIAEKTIKEVLDEKKIEYEVEEGGAKFYGPALDIKIFDAIGREWQCPTIQLDMNLPDKFGMTYIGKDGKEHVPIMVHRTIFGAMERFCAILIEHYAGAFPLWLSPVQTAILPVSDKFGKYAEKVEKELKENDIRVEMFNSDDSLGKRIAEATKQKIPYILVVGEKEEKDGSVAVRERDGKNPNSAKASKGKQTVIKLDKFIEKIEKEIVEKK